MQKVTKMKILRIQQGLNAYEIAYMIGVHPSVYSLYETARAKIPHERAQKIAEILNCHPEELQKIINQKEG